MWSTEPSSQDGQRAAQVKLLKKKHSSESDYNSLQAAKIVMAVCT